ncbi:MAG: hypothetical protein HYS04_12275 [Acidobacteria bacterium]|nr:hypothetical protein [Acidobacteriota bacterium]
MKLGLMLLPVITLLQACVGTWKTHAMARSGDVTVRVLVEQGLADQGIKIVVADAKGERLLLNPDQDRIAGLTEVIFDPAKTSVGVLLCDMLADKAIVLSYDYGHGRTNEPSTAWQPLASRVRQRYGLSDAELAEYDNDVFKWSCSHQGRLRFEAILPSNKELPR